MIMKSSYLKVGGCVVLVLVVVIGVVVFWQGPDAPLAKQEQVEEQVDAQPARPSAPPRSIREIELARARETGISTAARANPEAERLYVMALRHAKPVGPDSFKILSACESHLNLSYSLLLLEVL